MFLALGREQSYVRIVILKSELITCSLDLRAICAGQCHFSACQLSEFAAFVLALAELQGGEGEVPRMVVLGRRGRGGQERGGLHHRQQERQEEAEVEQDQVERIERTHCPSPFHHFCKCTEITLSMFGS